MKVGWVCPYIVEATGLPFVCKIGHCPDCAVYHDVMRLNQALKETLPECILKEFGVHC